MDRSSLELHAAIWRKAARVVAAMDELTTTTAEIQAAGGTSRAYSAEEWAAFTAYRNAARCFTQSPTNTTAPWPSLRRNRSLPRWE